MQLGFVAEQRHVGLQRQAQLRPLRGGLKFLQDHLQHPHHVDELLVRFALGRFEARELDQIAQDPRHAVRLAQHLGDRAAPARGNSLVVGERIEVAIDDGERRAQLVRCVRDEIAARALELHSRG